MIERVTEDCRIIEWLRLERTFRDPVQPLSHGQRHLKLDQVAQSPFQSHFLLYICQYKSIDPCPVTTHPGKKVFSFFLISPFFILKGQSGVFSRLNSSSSQPVFSGNQFLPSDHFHGPPLQPL